MSIQTRYGVVDDETRQWLKDTVEKRVREELGKLRNEMVNVAMTANSRVVVKRGVQNIPKFGGEDVKGWFYKCEEFFRIDNVPDERKVSLISHHLFDIALVWHKKFLSIVDENVAWMSYKKAILLTFGNSFDGSSRVFSSSKSVEDLSLHSQLVDKLEELLVNNNRCEVNWKELNAHIRCFDEMPIMEILKQDTIAEYCDASVKESIELLASCDQEGFGEVVNLGEKVTDIKTTDEVIDDEKVSDDMKVKSVNSEILVMEDDGFVSDENISKLLLHKNNGSIVHRQKGFPLLGRYVDKRNVEGWEDEDKDLSVFDYDCDAYDLSIKALIGEKEFFVNKKQEENLDKVTPRFAHMSSQTRSWSSVLRTKDACKLGIISKNGKGNLTKNGANLGHLKFDIWKWPKRKKIDDTNCKFTYGKRQFDVWKWPRRKKERKGAKSHKCCVRCGVAGLGLIYSGQIRGKRVHKRDFVLEDQAGKSMEIEEKNIKQLKPLRSYKGLKTIDLAANILNSNKKKKYTHQLVHLIQCLDQDIYKLYISRLSDIFVVKLDESDDERVTGNGLKTKVAETSLDIEYLENFLVATSRLLKDWHGHYRAVTCLVLSMDLSRLISGARDGSVWVWSLLMLLD
ncbi:floral homeotic protein [Tanacetum coccineum]|uniref:Floral homeotic protein n=1 Tax=Tanacetum coccineum TaxID=301880 RepID=A0ABQ4XD78_9ASTR